MTVATTTELTLHLGHPSGELSQHTLDVADVNIPLLENSLQVCDPLFVTTRKLFCFTLPLEVVIQKLLMAVRPPIYTGGKNACIQGLHGDYIVIL